VTGTPADRADGPDTRAPVLVGGGTPYFSHQGRRVALELVETRTFASGVVYLRHRVRR
jgi:dihydrofolate reductase